MGVDTVIRLSPAAQVRYVGEAIAILLGNKWSNSQHGSWIDVEGFKIRAASDSGCCFIEVECRNAPKCADVNGTGAREFFYHFEGQGGSRVMRPRSHAVNIAIGVALVKLFGGAVVFDDCDGKVNRRAPTPRWLSNLDSNANFHKLQDALRALKPLIEADIRKYDKWAAYKLED